jgi:transposase
MSSNWMEALQAIRIRYRQAAITKEREQKEKWKKDGNKRKDLPDAETYENGETERPFSPGVDTFCSSSEKWTETQAERAEILFREFPEIKEAYDLICSFRNFYCQIGKGHRARESLGRWYEKTKTSKIEEIRSPAHDQNMKGK